MAATDVPAVLASGVLFLIVFTITAVLAQATYRLIELPAIGLGARAIGRPDRPVVTTI